MKNKKFLWGRKAAEYAVGGRWNLTAAAAERTGGSFGTGTRKNVSKLLKILLKQKSENLIKGAFYGVFTPFIGEKWGILEKISSKSHVFVGFYL